MNMEELVRALAVSFAREAQLKGVKLVTRVPPGANCVSDRRLLMLVLHNLLSNAVKYSDKGTITVAVDPLDDGAWQLSVADEGRGMSEDFKQRMFGEFVREEGHDRPGVGLGLAIVARAVNLLGAKIAVDSKPGVGTIFRITCPAMNQPA